MIAQHHETIRTGREFRETLRAGPYAWPGGYPLALLMSDGETLCFDCGKTEGRQIIQSIRLADRSGWRAIGCFIHWEGPAEICAHCGAEIPSAYGEVE